MAMVKAHLKARDIMSVDPVCVHPSTTIRALARVFEDNQVSGAPVVDREGRVVGVVSKSDLIRRCSEGSDDVPPSYLFEVLFQKEGQEAASDIVPEALMCVEDFMTRQPLTIGPDAPAASIARLMFDRRAHRVIVTDKDRFPVGIITSMDLLGFFPPS